MDNQEKLAKKDDILAAKASPIQKLVSLTEESKVPSNTTTNIQNASIKKKPLGPKSKRAKRIGKRLTKLKLLNDALKCRITALETNVSSDNALQQQNSNYKQRTFGGMPRMILSTAPSNTSAFPVPDNIWNNTGRSDYYNPYAPGISKSDSRQMYHPSYTRFPQGSRQHMIQESRSAGMIPVQTSYLSKISLPPRHSNAKLHMNQIPAVLRSARSLKAAWPPPSRSNSPNAVGAVQGVPSALTKYPQHSTNKLDDLLVQSFTDITSQYSAEDDGYDYDVKPDKQRKKGGRRKHEKSSGRKSRKIKY